MAFVWMNPFRGVKQKVQQKALFGMQGLVIPETCGRMRIGHHEHRLTRIVIRHFK